jgi:hypothetical protein
MILFAVGETWFAVFGGLIPIIGLAGLAFVIYRAVGKNGDSDEETTRDEEARSSEEDRDR